LAILEVGVRAGTCVLIASNLTLLSSMLAVCVNLKKLRLLQIQQKMGQKMRRENASKELEKANQRILNFILI